MMKLGIVVPCYNEEKVLKETASKLLNMLAKLIENRQISAASKIYFVDDGSDDGTWSLIEQFSTLQKNISGIKLSCNRGHQNALLAGLFTASGDAIVSIDADLQDDVDVIKNMVDDFHQGMEIVYGVRRDRATDSTFKRVTANWFYRMMRVLGANMIFDHADYRLMSRPAIKALMEFREVNLFLRGIVPLVGFKSSIVYYERTERFAGKSKYSLKKMLAFAWDGVTSFSIVPLRIITAMGFMVFILSLMLIIWVLGVRFLTDSAVPGWASTVLPVYFIGGIQILCIGVIGEYLGKVYQEVKARPRYIIEKIIEIKE